MKPMTTSILSLLLLFLVPGPIIAAQLPAEARKALKDLASLDPEVWQAACATLASSAVTRDGMAAIEGELQTQVKKLQEKTKKIDALASWRSRERHVEAREKALSTWARVRDEALMVIFDRTAYRDDDHGESTQALVNAKVQKVREIFEAFDRAVRDDLLPFEKLDARGARKLLEGLTQQRAVAERLASCLQDAGSEARNGFQSPDPFVLAMLRLASGEPVEPVDAGPYAGYLMQRFRDTRVLARNREVAASRPSAGVQPTAHEAQQVELTNQYRILMGRVALELEPTLVACARAHSEEMHRMHYFSHTSPTAENRTADQRALKAGYAADVAENIALGSTAPRQAHDSWFTSAPHHRNILDPDHRAMGAGRQGEYWTQNFGSVTMR